MNARRTRTGKQPPPPLWLVSYSDLMTLLVAFFVLLLSMSSINRIMLSRISPFGENLTAMAGGASGRIPERIRILVQLLRDQESVLTQQDRIKDLLFPNEALPPELPAGDLKENLRILQHPEGVVIVLTGGLLFAEGSHTLDKAGHTLLDALTPVILAVETDVNISGYADTTEKNGMDADTLSASRALAVLEHFLQAGITPDRFSISGYGADKPLESEKKDSPMNRRVEILLKTTPRLGAYL